MKMAWEGGPLDGATKEMSKPLSFWYGPDPAAPQEKAIVYTMCFSDGVPVYRFDQSATDALNREIAQKRGLRSD